MVEITYLLIPDAIEAEVKISLLPFSGIYDYYSVSSTIKACPGGDFRGHHVSLFASTEPNLILSPSLNYCADPLHLSSSSICLPHRPHLELEIEVDLRLRYGENVSNIISNMKFTPRTRRLFTEVGTYLKYVSLCIPI
jgi:hypothetical protein